MRILILVSFASSASWAEGRSKYDQKDVSIGHVFLKNSVQSIGTTITKEEYDLNNSFSEMWRSVVEFMR